MVQGAIDAVQGGYTYEDSNVGTSPINFVKNGAALTMDNSNYILGPYKIEELTNTDYTLSAELYSTSGTIANATVLDSNKQEVQTGNTLAEKIQSTIGSNFYIRVPISSNISSATLKVSAEYYNTVQTFWSVGANNLAYNQPVVIVSEINKNLKMLAQFK